MREEQKIQKQSLYDMACALNSKCEETSEELRKYPVIFDKSDPGHKDLRMQENAWNAVSNYLDFVDSPTKGKAYFESLEERYTKTRNDVRKSEKSGTSLAEKEKALNAFKLVGPIYCHTGIEDEHK